MKLIKINFCDFWQGFEKNDNYFYHLLKKLYSIEISDNPDFLIYSVFGQEYSRYHCYKIQYIGENQRPDFSECNFAFSFDYLEQDNHFRLPLYAWYLLNSPCSLRKDNLDLNQILREKKKFCNFVYSNDKAAKRNEFFYKLSQYKQVDAGGRCFNNIGGMIGPSIADKLNFMRNYKFTIAFENSAYPGYTTEKIIQPMQVHSLPLYWGNESVWKDFNPKSFINYYDYADEDKLIQKIIEVDQDDDLYRQYLTEPYFYNNCDNEFIREENVLGQFKKIFG